MPLFTEREKKIVIFDGQFFILAFVVVVVVGRVELNSKSNFSSFQLMKMDTHTQTDTFTRTKTHTHTFSLSHSLIYIHFHTQHTEMKLEGKGTTLGGSGKKSHMTSKE